MMLNKIKANGDFRKLHTLIVAAFVIISLVICVGSASPNVANVSPAPKTAASNYGSVKGDILIFEGDGVVYIKPNKRSKPVEIKGELAYDEQISLDGTKAAVLIQTDEDDTYEYWL